MSHQKVFDVIVVGGGPSGVCAAISAARNGLDVLLIERYGFLGGMNTAGLVGPLMTFHAGNLQIVRGIPDELIEELKSQNGSPGHLVDPIWGSTSLTPIDTDIYKGVLIKKTTSAGVEHLLHSMVIGIKRSGSELKEIQVANKKGIQTFQAKTFIDCSGDGDLAFHSGCKFQFGREKDNLAQPMSLLFKMNDVDESAIRSEIRRNPKNFYLGFELEKYLSLEALAVSGFFEEVTTAKKEGRFPADRDRVLFFGTPKKGQIIVNTLRISKVDGTNPHDLTRAEITLRLELPKLVHFMKSDLPGFSNSSLGEVAAQVGIRETRHIFGRQTLTTQDVLTRKCQDSVIAHANYPIDVHSPDGSGMTIQQAGKTNRTYYDIPAGALMPRGMDNLLVCGRSISAEHEASGSARISATCMALGQACGVMASEMIKFGVRRFEDIKIANVQSQLENMDAFLEPPRP